METPVRCSVDVLSPLVPPLGRLDNTKRQRRPSEAMELVLLLKKSSVHDRSLDGQVRRAKKFLRIQFLQPNNSS